MTAKLPSIILVLSAKIYLRTRSTLLLPTAHCLLPTPITMSQRPKISVGPFHFYSTGIRISGRPKLDDWQGPLEFAIWCQRAGPWWIGDLINAGEDGFGEAFSQMCEGLVSTEMLSRYASVARRVPFENRRPNLSWSAHAAVARLDSKQQRRLLAAADREGWTSEELRVRARELKANS